jgi:hypothetical protein
MCSFFQSIGRVLMLAKMDWATFWAIFPQTHLVTLPETPDLMLLRR